MLIRHFGAANGEAPTAGRFDQLPGLVSGRVDECAAAGSQLDGLALVALSVDLSHAVRDFVLLSRLALERCR